MPSNKQRREAARRHLERQLQSRQARETRRRRATFAASIVGTIVIVLVIVIFVVAVSHDDNKKNTAAASPTPTAPLSSDASSPAASTSAAPTAVVQKVPCVYAKDTTGTAARKVTVPPTNPPQTGKVVINVGTSQGAMTFTLNRAGDPCTVASFVSLVQQGYYTNTPCHRLTTTGIYVLQCGDPTGKGTGGPGYTIPDQYTGKEAYTRGVLAMANTGAANSGGSQFFIVYKDTQLPAKYTIFGTVTSGLPVVDKVAAAGSNNANGQGDGNPKLPITLTTVKVA